MTASIVVGVVLREDDAAPLALAGRLARLADAPLILVTVLPPEVPRGFPSPEYARALRDEITQRLRDVARGLGDGVATRVLEGSAAGALHELTEEIRPAAVVVGSTHRGVVGRLLVGQVATGLLHGAGSPVAIAPQAYDGSDGMLERIGVAFDGSPEARVALEAGIGLVGRAGGKLVSYTVREPIDPISGYTPPGLPEPPPEDAQQGWAQTTAEAALESFPEGLDGTSEVVHGQVVKALARVSAELDLLICGSRGYGAVRQVLAGSVARGLAHEAACPLLVVPRKPSRAAAALWRAERSVEPS